MTAIEEVDLKKILPSNGPSIQEVKKYLDKYKNEYIVIKIGGSINDESLFKILIEDISILKKINFNPILVHGGGKRLTAKLNQLNIESKFVGGLRVSNKDVVKIAQDVFIEFNKEILNELKNYSVNARSITSKENNIINVKAISEELGFVGTPYKIDADVLTKIVKANEIPIIAPLGLNSENQVYNINADNIATFLASSLNARRLIFISDVAGVLDKDNNLKSIIQSGAKGNPLNLGQTVTQGIISATGRNGLSNTNYLNFLQMDAAINNGNSGGALINSNGVLVGINSRQFTQSTSQLNIQGIFFAVPYQLAAKIMYQIIENGRVVRGWLGITAERYLTDMKGFLVQAVNPKSPAFISGIQAGDVIYQIGDLPVTSITQALDIVAETRPNTILVFKLYRQGKVIETSVTIAEFSN